MPIITRRIYSLFACLIVLSVNSCAPASQLSKTKIAHLLAKRPEACTIQQSDSIIRSYTTSNISRYDASNPYQSISGNKVYIKVTPFNRHVICATVRKEAIQKRFSIPKFRQRLKEDLESFTDNGKRLFLDEKNIGQYRLVFNGLQEKSIVLDWRHF